MKMIRQWVGALFLIALGACVPTSASANYCGGSTAWKMLTSTAYVTFADPALQSKLWFYERWQVRQALESLETRTVGQAQINALEQLKAIARAKLDMQAARRYERIVDELVGKVHHIVAEHRGDLDVADRAEGNAPS